MHDTSAMPGGTITFLFTDVEGSTRGWLRNAQAMSAALARHDELIEQLVAEHAGQVVRPRGEGDSRFVVFARASDAVTAAFSVQLALAEEQWSLIEPLRVRMAVHTGEAELRQGDYYGQSVNHCARLRAIAHGGQVVVSAVTADLVREALPIGAGLRDLGLHQLKDLDRPERVWQVVHPKLRADFPPLLSQSTRRHNLPNQVSSFIGRDREITDVQRLLEHARLVTLTGAGGVGKTRLGLRVAAEALANSSGGVWLVELAPLADPTLVPQTVAAALGLREQPARSWSDVLIGTLESRRDLLLFDNCEHLVEACAELAEMLLRACPHLRILATSREALGIAGEAIWRVPSLALPDPRILPASETVAEYAAIQLFCDRAKAALPGFGLTDRNTPAVVEICTRLDGIPLAIELAAARVNVLAPEQIASRLDDRLRLLVGGSRTAPPRQQTLRATLGWSYDLLSVDEQRLLERLSVFAGGCSLEAAETVCVLRQAEGDPEDLEKPHILDLLGQLIYKSLVVAELPADGAMRYQLLETVRQYARERLVELGHWTQTQRNHAAYWLGLVDQAYRTQLGPDQVRWFQLFDREHSDLRAALGWALESGETDTATRLGAGLCRFWSYRGHVAEAVSWLERLVALPGAWTPAKLDLLFWAGVLAMQRGSPTAAASHYERLRQASTQQHYPRGVAMALTGLGHIARMHGTLDEAQALYEQAIANYEIARTTDSSSTEDHTRMDQYRRFGIAMNLLSLGSLALDRRDYAAARRLGDDALSMAEDLRDDRVRVGGLQLLGAVNELEGELEAARRTFTESVELSRKLPYVHGLVRGLQWFARLAIAEGQPERALRLYGAAVVHAEAGGIPVNWSAEWAAAQDSHLFAIARQSVDEAAAEAAVAAGRALSLEQAVLEALGGGADVALVPLA